MNEQVNDLVQLRCLYNTVENKVSRLKPDGGDGGEGLGRRQGGRMTVLVYLWINSGVGESQHVRDLVGDAYVGYLASV